jgi:4-amino-4-deoxy-L-arabinose transferase-like glycosyltransferase
VLIGHIDTLDMGVTFFITLGIFSLLLAQSETEVKKQRNWMLLAWAGMALAVLSKGLMGLILPGTAVLIYCILQRDLTLLKRMHWFPGLAVFFLIVSPWFYLVMKANPEFFERFFIYEHFTRFTTKDLGRYQPWYYFVPILLAGALPWTVLMFDSAMRAWRGGVRADKAFSPERFLLIWAVFIYVFFSVSGSKLPSYLLPMFPALALLMAVRLTQIRERVLMWQLVPVIPALLVLIVTAANIRRFADTPLQAELYPQYAVWLILGVAILLAGVLLAIGLLKRERKMIAVLILAFSSLLCAQISLSGYNTIAHERSAKHIAAAIKEYVKPDIIFYSILDYEQTLPFYLKHTFTLVQYQDEMAYGIKQEPYKAIATLAEFAPAWRAQTQALAIMPAQVYPAVQQLGIEMKIIYQDTQYIVVKKP